jgi:hypothetical protein
VRYPEVIALRRISDDDEDPVAGWAMVIGGRVVAYVPARPEIVGSGLLSTYSSLDAADRVLGYAGLYPDTDWSPPGERPAP